MWSENPFHLQGKPSRTPLRELADHPSLRDPVSRTAARLLYPLAGPEDSGPQGGFWNFWRALDQHPDAQRLHDVVSRWTWVTRSAQVRAELQVIVGAETSWEGTLDAAYERADQTFFESLYRLARRQQDVSLGRDLVDAAREHWIPTHDAPARRALRGCGPLQHRLPPFEGPLRRPAEARRRACLDALRNYNQAGLAWFEFYDIQDLMRKRDFAAGLAQVRKAREQHPDSAKLICVEASFLSLQGRNSEALAHLERELARRPDLPGGLLQKSLTVEDPDQRLALYRQTLEREPHHTVAHFGLAQGLLRRGEAQEARDAIEDCLCLDPDDGDAWYVHAHTLHLLGAPREHMHASLVQAGLRGQPQAIEMLGYDPREG